MERAVRIGVFKKFGAFAIVTGLLPLIITVLVLSFRMRSEFYSVMKSNYTQSAITLQDRLDSLLDTYDNISSMPYYYRFGPDDNYLSFDAFRRIFYGYDLSEGEKEAERKRNVESFLSNLVRIDPYVVGAAFIGYDEDGKLLAFSVDSVSGGFAASEVISMVDWTNSDKTYRGMTISGIIPYRANTDVFVVSRNYYDIRGQVSSLNYIGTLYLFIDVARLDELLSSAKRERSDQIYLLQDGTVWYSGNESAIGKPLPSWDGNMLFYTSGEEHGVSVSMEIDPDDSYGAINTLYALAFILLALSILLFTVGIMFISRRFSSQMQSLFKGMDRVERGDFNVPEVKGSRDELGELYERFRKMGARLEAYIDKAYSAQLKQKEADLTALKSQIYPHFLYNTLEVIRMSALNSNDEKTAEMIEALSEQIHYLIGPVRDFVPLSYEIKIVEKYIFLLNCRTEGSIQFVSPKNYEDTFVPKLILQPLVENAYIHGLKPKGGKGSIAVDVIEEGSSIEISVLDTGIGMDSESLRALTDLLEGDSIGIKDEYAWKSIGLKNVYDRIKLLFGSDYGLSIDSEKGVGTVISIRLPRNIKGEEDVPFGDGR